MELWIRSQDRDYFIPIKDVISIFNGRLFYRDITLGKYKTQKRAFEVLDEIENLIYAEVNIVNYPYQAADIEIKSSILCNMVKIFEMPKE